MYFRTFDNRLLIALAIDRRLVNWPLWELQGSLPGASVETESGRLRMGVKCRACRVIANKQPQFLLTTNGDLAYKSYQFFCLEGTQHSRLDIDGLSLRIRCLWFLARLFGSGPRCGDATAIVSLPQPHLSVPIKNRLPRRDRIIKTSESFSHHW
jgi:hypothetical protein